MNESSRTVVIVLGCQVSLRETGCFKKIASYFFSSQEGEIFQHLLKHLPGKQTRRFRAHSAILHNTCDRGAVLLEARSARLLTQFSLRWLLGALEGHIQTF